MKDFSDLYCDSVGVSAVDFDFGEGYGETWETITPDFSECTLSMCHKYLRHAGAGYPDPNPWDMCRNALVRTLEEAGIESYDIESNETLRAAVISNIDDGTIEGLQAWQEACTEAASESDKYSPMMNYYYPLPNYDRPASRDQHLIEDTACVLVEVNGKTVLALAGGGMDLSWDICEAYMLLGYLPPLAYCNLPEYGGLKLDPRHERILGACLRTCECARLQAKNAADHLNHIRRVLEVT